jgi:hypothetical protein
MFVSGRLIRSAAQRGYLPAMFSRTGATDLPSLFHRHASRLWRSTDRQYTAVPTGEELATLRHSSLVENFSESVSPESNKRAGDVPMSVHFDFKRLQRQLITHSAWPWL